MSVTPGIERATPRLLPIAALSLAVVVLDLSTKSTITEWLGVAGQHNAWWVIDGRVGLEYGRNSGAAFGLFRGNPELLAVLSVFVAAGFCWLSLVELRSGVASIACAGLIVGGATGNLIERVRLGYVTDFFAVGPWPRFNVADSAISIGVVIFIVAMVFQPLNERADGPGEPGRNSHEVGTRPGSE